MKVSDEDANTLSFAATVAATDADLLFGCGLDGLLDEARLSTTSRGAGSDLLKTATDSEYNMRNQLVQDVTGAVTKNYSYDLNGNNTSVTGGANTITMAYDTLNRLTSWTDGTNTETHTYRGAEWHRHSTTANGSTTAFLYDGDNVVADFQSRTRMKEYVTPFLDQNLSVTIPTGLENAGTYYYSQDGLGSVRTLTDAAGAVVNKYDYSAFGETYAPGTSETVAQRYTYTGREQSALGAFGAPMYYRVRMVWNELGRFGQRAPEIWEANRYEGHFFPNDTDPFGLPQGMFGPGGQINPAVVPSPKPKEDKKEPAKVSGAISVTGMKPSDDPFFRKKAKEHEEEM